MVVVVGGHAVAACCLGWRLECVVVCVCVCVYGDGERGQVASICLLSRALAI